MEDDKNRILGCLAGLAVGDAMGRPTELLFHYRRIERKYGRVTTLIGKNPGLVTDDTRLTLTLADAIIKHGRMITADELIDYWKNHPEFSWHKFLKSWNRNDGFWFGEHIVAWGGRVGIPGHLTGYLNMSSLVAGNEAAMIMAPVGILYRGRAREAAAKAFEVSRAMVRGQARHAASGWAAAIAAALSEGATVESVVEAAKANAGPKMREHISSALSIAEPFSDVYDSRPALYSQCLQRVFVDARETVPIALAMFQISRGDPMTAIAGGANFGRDADTIAGMAGLLSGALSGIERIDPGIYRQVCDANGFDLEDYAERLASVLP